MASTIYIRQPKKALSFTRLPNFLFEVPIFKPLSNETKILCALILRRTELSRKNGWADDYGRIYPYYPIYEVIGLLHCGQQEIVNTLRELRYAGLVEIQKQGCGKPSRIFLKSYEAILNTDLGKSGSGTPEGQKPYLRSEEIASRKCENQTAYRNTEIKKVYLYSIRSNPIRANLYGIFPMENPGQERNGGKSRTAQHAILRFEKHKGNPTRPLETHHERQKEQYASNPGIDTSRSKHNFHIVKPKDRYYRSIQNRIEQAGCRTRKDSTQFVNTLAIVSPEFFKGKSPKEIQAFFQGAADFLIGRVGRENIVLAVVHMDEKTPHLHLTFVSLTKDNRLCVKEIIGNRANPTKRQDDSHAYMVEKYLDLERGESASRTGWKRTPTRLFKQATSLSRQAGVIEAALDGINPLDAGKKKEEALPMLKKWFPQMGSFSGRLKEYKVTVNDLLAEDEKLEAGAKASEKEKMKDTIERAKLKNELDNLQWLVDRIPPDILAELKRQQWHTVEER